MDLDSAFIPHFLKIESMSSILEEGLKSELFFDSSVGEMFSFCFQYYVDSAFEKVPTRDLLETEFSTWFTKFEVDEEEYLLSYLLEKIRERYRRTNIQNTLRSIGSGVMDDPEVALIEGISSLTQIQFDTSTSDRFEIYSQSYEQRLKDYHDRVLRVQEEREDRGFTLGWPEVTEFTYGLKTPEVGVLVASPNTGKSWTLAQMAASAAESGAIVYFASLENSKELTLMRLDCLFSGVPFRQYERGKLNREEVSRIKEAREKIEALGDRLIVDTPSRATERTVFELYSRAKFFGADVFVGDQLSWVQARGRYLGTSADTQAMSEVITDITMMSRELSIASIWAAQFNRQAMSSRQGRGGLQHIALSSTIEQIVDWAFSISSTEEMKSNSSLVFEIIKSRRTELKAWLMNWSLKDRTELSVNREWVD